MQPAHDTEPGGFLKHASGLEQEVEDFNQTESTEENWGQNKTTFSSGVPTRTPLSLLCTEFQVPWSSSIHRSYNEHDWPDRDVDMFIGKCENRHLPLWSISLRRFSSPCETQSSGFYSSFLFRPSFHQPALGGEPSGSFSGVNSVWMTEGCLPKMALNVLPRTQ